MQKKELMAQEYLAGKFIPFLWMLCPKKKLLLKGKTIVSSREQVLSICSYPTVREHASKSPTSIRKHMVCCQPHILLPQWNAVLSTMFVLLTNETFPCRWTAGTTAATYGTEKVQRLKQKLHGHMGSHLSSQPLAISWIKPHFYRSLANARIKSKISNWKFLALYKVEWKNMKFKKK